MRPRFPPNAVVPADPQREAAYEQWWNGVGPAMGVVVRADDATHEAYCAGWVAALATASEAIEEHRHARRRDFRFMWMVVSLMLLFAATWTTGTVSHWLIRGCVGTLGGIVWVDWNWRRESR